MASQEQIAALAKALCAKEHGDDPVDDLVAVGQFYIFKTPMGNASSLSHPGGPQQMPLWNTYTYLAAVVLDTLQDFQRQQEAHD